MNGWTAETARGDTVASIASETRMAVAPKKTSPLRGLLLDTLKASLPTSKFPSWQLCRNAEDEAGLGLALPQATVRAEHRRLLETALLGPDLSEAEIVRVFVCPLLSWLVDPNWPVADLLHRFIAFLVSQRPALVALALEEILGGLVPELEQQLELSTGTEALAPLIGIENGGTGDIEVGLLLVEIDSVARQRAHPPAGVAGASAAFASRKKLCKMVRQAARLERDARQAGKYLLDGWDRWYDDSDEPAPNWVAYDGWSMVDVFGFLSKLEDQDEGEHGDGDGDGDGKKAGGSAKEDPVKAGAQDSLGAGTFSALEEENPSEETKADDGGILSAAATAAAAAAAAAADCPICKQPLPAPDVCSSCGSLEGLVAAAAWRPKAAGKVFAFDWAGGSVSPFRVGTPGAVIRAVAANKLAAPARLTATSGDCSKDDTRTAKDRDNFRVLDLGSGDGTVLIELVRWLQQEPEEAGLHVSPSSAAAAAGVAVSGIGVELNQELVEESRRRAAAAGVGAAVQFTCEDMFERLDTDEGSWLGSFNIIFLYLLPAALARLAAPLSRARAAGTHIVSLKWPVARWSDHERERAEVAARGKGWVPVFVYRGSEKG